MNFLYPAFLWSLSALSIPILIHLFNFRKTTRVYFSNTRILKQVKEVTTAKRKLKYYLILLARLLFLAFLVIAFAQPIIPARDQLDTHRDITLYLDNSLSMSAQLEDQDRALDVGVAFVQDIVDLFPTETRYRLITNDFAPFSNSLKTKEEVVDLLTQVRLSPISRSATEILNRIRLVIRAADDEVFWISDFQRSTFGIPSEKADSLVRWHLVPISPDVSDNIFVDTAYLDNPFAIGQEKNSLKVKVRNDGSHANDQLNLKLTINNIQAATAGISIPAGGVSEISFDLATGLTGLNQAHLSFNDLPVSFDNDFYLALNYIDKIRVLEIKPSSQPTAIQQVFGNKQVFTYAGYPVGNFNYSLLNQADLVVVNGINAPDESLSLALRAYLNNFGTLLFIPGSKPDLSSYRSLLQLPLSLQDQTIIQEMDHPDFNNPFFENVFEEKSVSIAMPGASEFLEWGEDRSAILRFKNGKPFLSAFQQSGKLYVLSCPLEESFTDFNKNALFVPVMYRMASTAKKTIARPYYTLSENIVSLKVDSLPGEESLRMEGNQEIIPSQRKVGDRVLLDIPKYALTQGFYYITSEADTLDLFAFNLDKDESLMARYTVAEVRHLLGEGDHLTVFEAGSTEAFSNEIKARYLGKPLWKYALMVALFFLLMEILLIRFMKQ
jgi:Aerotolerance regulator N-terminal